MCSFSFSCGLPQFSFQFSALFLPADSLAFRLPLFLLFVSFREASVLALLFHAPLELRISSLAFAPLSSLSLVPLFCFPSRSDRFLSSALTGTRDSLSLAPRTFFPTTLLPPNLPGSFFPSCFPCRLLQPSGLPASVPLVPRPHFWLRVPSSRLGSFRPRSAMHPTGISASLAAFLFRPSTPSRSPETSSDDSAFRSAFASLTHRASAFPLSLSGFPA